MRECRRPTDHTERYEDYRVKRCASKDISQRGETYKMEKRW